jgi:hypothetical protein
MTDPLLNEIHFTQEGIGVAMLEPNEYKLLVIEDIQKTLQRPIAIYESKSKENTRYYFQYFKSTVFMCIVKKNEEGWYLEDTLFNPPKEETELILARDSLLYAK